MIDYKELLINYMAVIIYNESVDYVDRFEGSDEDKLELTKLSEEADRRSLEY